MKTYVGVLSAIMLACSVTAFAGQGPVQTDPLRVRQDRRTQNRRTLRQDRRTLRQGQRTLQQNRKAAKHERRHARRARRHAKTGRKPARS